MVASSGLQRHRTEDVGSQRNRPSPDGGSELIVVDDEGNDDDKTFFTALVNNLPDHSSHECKSPSLAFHRDHMSTFDTREMKFKREVK